MSEITHARVLKIGLPIVLSNATIPLLGAVDTAVIGQLGEAAALGGIGIGAVTLAAVYWIFGFLRMGTSGLTAQAQGAGDLPERDAIFLRGLGIALVAGLGMILLQGLLIDAAFSLAPASAAVESHARSYLDIRIWGAPATISIYAITGWLIALERTRAVLILQLGINLVNILLDLWFVLGLGWGVPGVAVATLFAEYSGLALGLWFCRDALRNPAARARQRLLAAAPWRRMIAVNSDIMIRSILLQGSFTSFVFLGAGMGDEVLAANQVLLQFLEITAYALDGFAFAAEAIVGQAVGAKKLGDLRRGALLSSIWAVGASVLMAAGFALGGGAIIDLITTSPEVRETARAYLPWVILAPLVSVASYMFDGIFIGATETKAMRNSMLLSVGLFVVCILTLVPMMDNHGLWLALVVMNAARGLTLLALYPRVEARAL